MSKIENGPAARVLRDDELDAVTGGFQDAAAVGIIIINSKAACLEDGAVAPVRVMTGPGDR